MSWSSNHNPQARRFSARCVRVTARLRQITTQIVGAQSDDGQTNIAAGGYVVTRTKVQSRRPAVLLPDNGHIVGLAETATIRPRATSISARHSVLPALRFRPPRKWCRSLGFPESQIAPSTCNGQTVT
jgi:hypothetical protein